MMTLLCKSSDHKTFCMKIVFEIWHEPTSCHIWISTLTGNIFTDSIYNKKVYVIEKHSWKSSSCNLKKLFISFYNFLLRIYFNF